MLLNEINKVKKFSQAYWDSLYDELNIILPADKIEDLNSEDIKYYNIKNYNIISRGYIMRDNVICARLRIKVEIDNKTRIMVLARSPYVPATIEYIKLED